MSKIFISYSHKDKEFANKLVEELQNYCLSIWIDKVEMRPGDTLLKEISGGINKSDFLAVILSPDSIESKWVRKEVKLALEKENASREFRVIPIIYRDCKILRFLKGKIWADFRTSYSEGLKSLLEGVCRDKEIIKYTIDSRAIFNPDSKAIEKAVSLVNSSPPKDFLFVYEDKGFLDELNKVWYTKDELNKFLKGEAIQKQFFYDIMRNKRAIPLLIENFKLVLPKYIQVAVNYLGRDVSGIDLVTESIGILTKMLFLLIIKKIHHFGNTERIKEMTSVNGENILAEFDNFKDMDAVNYGFEAYVFGSNPEEILYLGFAAKENLDRQNSTFDVTARVPKEAIAKDTLEFLSYIMYPLFPDQEIFETKWIKYFMPEIAFYHLSNVSYVNQIITKQINRIGLKKSDYFHFGYE